MISIISRQFLNNTITRLDDESKISRINASLPTVTYLLHFTWNPSMTMAVTHALCHGDECKGCRPLTPLIRVFVYSDNNGKL